MSTTFEYQTIAIPARMLVMLNEGTISATEVAIYGIIFRDGIHSYRTNDEIAQITGKHEKHVARCIRNMRRRGLIGRKTTPVGRRLRIIELPED